MLEQEEQEWRRSRPVAPAVRSRDELELLRTDFAYWAERCVTIRHKLTGRRVPFILNRAQRRLLEAMESSRRADRPIRVILLKSRQWGGSTLIQVYMAWIQMMHRENWHSLICAHVKDTAANIRGMYTGLLDGYPEVYVDEGMPRPEFKGFERSMNTRELAGRGCRVTIGSAESQDATRGNDFSMAHLSEVAFWRAGNRHDPADMMRAVTSGIAMQPCTLIAVESTANGVGNFFHSEWLRAESGQSAFKAVFVPWYETEYNELAVGDAEALWRELDDEERAMWHAHERMTLEQLHWYHLKRLEAPSRQAMMAEYPTTAVEAFVHSGCSVFDAVDIDRLREECRSPVAEGSVAGESLTGPGALRGVRFRDGERPVGGATSVWRHPEAGTGYLVTVDVGGRSATSDYSVIAVLRRPRGSEPPEIVAQWRGHLDHDLVAWRAASIATYYNRALLVIESNTLESESGGGEETDGIYLLQQLNHVYRNLYRRRTEDTVTTRVSSRVGFHTNRRTKLLIVNHLIAMVRDKGYIERDGVACNELATYRRHPNGSFGAREGCHDDLLMTRAIGLFVLSCEPRGVAEIVAPLKERRGRAGDLSCLRS